MFQSTATVDTSLRYIALQSCQAISKVTTTSAVFPQSNNRPQGLKLT